jgi:predicted dehydrogenase
MKRYTVGIVGLGYGRAHIAGFQAAGCDVVALCQRDLAAAQKLGAHYGVANAYAHWEDMLGEARPDIVVIATPPATHLPILRAALASGAHVVCEKPLALNAEEARTMIALATAARRSAITAFNWRFPRAMQTMKSMVAAGYLGRVFHINARWLNGLWADLATQPTWRMDRALAGHGALGDQGVHLIDMVRWLFGEFSGEFSQVLACSGIGHGGRMIPGGERAADAEDFSHVLAELDGGAQLSLTVSRVARGLNEHSLEVYGERGALSMRMGRSGNDWHHGELYAASGTNSIAPVALSAIGEERVHSTDRIEIIGQATVAPMIAQFIDSIERGESPSPSLDDGLRAQAVLDAILESTRLKRWVRVS